MDLAVFQRRIEENLEADSRATLRTASPSQLHSAVARALLQDIIPQWEADEQRNTQRRRAYYLSAEFLMGRTVFNNLYCAGALDMTREIFQKAGLDLNVLEDIEDAALGNGGLGRLAACFLDSAASLDIPLNGYGIRYRYGLFRQSIGNGFQWENADTWLEGDKDAWGLRCEADTVKIDFADQTVLAVPYDTPIIGYNRKSVNTLRLWQSEALTSFRFNEFDRQEYLKASEEKIRAEAVTNVLYPNDNYEAGLKLRLKQQYFFSSASLQDIIRKYKKQHGNDFSHFAQKYAIQLNDTHPTVAIPELIRLLMFQEGIAFGDAFAIAQKTFHYTNHTVMAEAMEKWSISLFRSVLPTVYEIIGLINNRLIADLRLMGQTEEEICQKLIVDGDRIHMARMAVYASGHTNGVAEIHTEILKRDVLKEWYAVYPDRFQNKTNGVTQRRWLGLCNPELSALIEKTLGSGDWMMNLDALKGLANHATPENLAEFRSVKRRKKEQLCAYIQKKEGVALSPDFIFDVQIKRLHEYKRQLLNAFGIMDIYFRIKEGKLPNWKPTAFLFGAKAAPAYTRAKGIIKYINEVARLVNNDPDTKDKMQALFVQDYNVSYAEKLIPAADFSEQISTAGTEASGTSNMKFMLNGAVTIGTMDGANVEIVQEAGEENEYIFGARVEEINRLKQSYCPKTIYQNNPALKRVVDTLIDGTFNDGDTGMFAELYKALLDGFSWHKPDHYFLFRDFDDYVKIRIAANQDYQDQEAFSKKCWMNIAGAGKFSSDRTIRQYAEELWQL